MGRVIFILVAIALIALLLGKPKAFGSKDSEIERRHPEKDFEDEDEAKILQRRKDDNVGGESG